MLIMKYRSGDVKYSHLAEADIQKVLESGQSAFNWLEKARQALAQSPRHVQPPYTTHQIRQERQVFCFRLAFSSHR